MLAVLHTLGGLVQTRHEFPYLARVPYHLPDTFGFWHLVLVHIATEELTKRAIATGTHTHTDTHTLLLERGDA